MPKVSVIVPVYNAEKYIKNCCENLLNQTYDDYEVIFVNDGSSDNSLKMLEKLASNHDKIQIITQENQGQAIARNIGIKHSKGEFICFIDIDDEISREMLEKLMHAQKKSDADLVWCDAYIKREGDILSTLDQTYPNSIDLQKNYVLHNASPWRKCIRRSLLESHNLYFPKLRFYEDLAVVPSYGLYTNKIIYVNEPLYSYVLHEGSTMHQKTYHRKLEDIFESMEILSNFIECSICKDSIKDELEYLYIDHLLHAASLRFFEFENTEIQLDKIVEIMKLKYPSWKKNKYFKQKDWKYKLVCHLLYRKKRKLLRYILK